MDMMDEQDHHMEEQNFSTADEEEEDVEKEHEETIKPEQFECEPVKGFKFFIKKRNDVYVPNTVINLTCLKNLKLKSDDVFIIGYPKSGTTWIEEIVWDLKHNLNYDLARTMSHFVRVPWVDMGFTSKQLSEPPSPRCFKSHLPVSFMPENFNNIAKVVYVVRNPKDIVVSSFDFFSACDGENEFVGTLDEMVDAFVQGKTMCGPWWNHVNEYAELANVHIVHYEDLIEKPMETVQKLANYLDVKVSDQEIEELLKFVSFDNMKTLPSIDFKIVGDVFKGDYCFFNKGKMGNWKRYLSDEHSEKIDDMVKFGLKYKKPLKYEP